MLAQLSFLELLYDQDQIYLTNSLMINVKIVVTGSFWLENKLTKSFRYFTLFQFQLWFNLPLVVSLSRTRKVPLLFSKLSSSLSESRRVILPKYHLVEVKTQHMGHKGADWWREGDMSGRKRGNGKSRLNSLIVSEGFGYSRCSAYKCLQCNSCLPGL